MNETISRLNAALDGRYTIEGKLGEGGMATVYLADDLRHERKVALKVLKPELAAVVGADRFLAEIKTTANLQHPHILPLFDSGEADGFLFYVMPYIEGETLADRITRDKQLPVDEALGIAASVAAALQTAHEAGIVHRDMKPGNVLMSRGEPLVSDFGIALAVGASGNRLTETGLSVGTPFYMSPEQATGDQLIGPSADIYALGCVLYEMLVGEPPYLGNTAQAVLGKIIQGVPVSATASRRSVPANVDAAIRKALEKLPADRFATAANFAAALSDPGFRHGADDASVLATESKRWRTAAIAASAVAVLAVLGSVTGAFTTRAADAPVLRQKIQLSSLGLEVPWGNAMALAPDGSGMVYKDRLDEDGPVQLFYKARDEAEGTPLPGTEDVNGVVFSPDGLWVAFTQNGSLVKRPVRGGAAVTLAEAVDQGVPGLDWMADGTILFEINQGDRLARMPEDGSAPADTIATLGSMRWAHGIEGHDLALTLNCPGCRLGLVDLSTGEVTDVLEDIARAWYVPAVGHLVYVRADGAVFASPFDPETRTLDAVGTPLFEGVRTGSGWADMRVADDGTMVYVTGDGSSPSEGTHPTWVSRDGTAEPVDPGWSGRMGTPRLSPDGNRVALSFEGHIWVAELPDGPRTRLTTEDGVYHEPSWTPDGRSIVFARADPAPYQLLRLRADGSSSAPEVLMEAEGQFISTDVTPDGAGVALTMFDELSVPDVAYFDFAADSITLRFGRAEFGESAAALSPDGRWLAYASAVTGTYEVFVRPFPDLESSRTQISNGGGLEPVWAQDGREIFYRSENGALTAAAYRATETSFIVESRVTLYDPSGRYFPYRASADYDVHPSGDRFLALRTDELDNRDRTREGEMILVQNWFTELKAQLRRDD